jgi:hypothetical protein
VVWAVGFALGSGRDTGAALLA